MVSVGTINSDAEEITVVFNKYNECINSINDNVWQGSSKNNFVTKTSEFVSAFSSPIESQMSMLSSAVSLYEKYKEKKEQKKVLENNYNNAVANEDSESASRYANEIANISSDLESLKQQIESKLSEICGIKLSSGGAKGDFVNYYQTDYGNVSYGYGTSIASSGCGPTSMAMVLTYLTGEEVDPPEAAEWSLEHGHRVQGNGTAWSYFDAISEEYGIECEQAGVSRNNIVSSLEEGETVIMSMGPGHFTRGGHFIVLTGITEDGKITVADPNSKTRSEQTWDPSVFVNEGKQMWSFTA